MLKKRLTGVLLALLMTMLVLSTAAFAQDTATITVSDAAAKAGETLDLVMSIQSGPGVSGASITVLYDKQAMQLTDIVPLAEGNFLKNLERSNFSWLKGKNMTGDFDLVKLCFKIADSASGTYTVRAELTGNLDANITNQDAIPVTAEFVSGKVTVEKNEIPGAGVGGGGGGGAGGGGAGGGGSSNGAVIEKPTEKPMEIIFEDVPADAYYYEAVLWAREKKITVGTTDTTFSPNNVCTRGQMVTFLWRAAGSPEPKTMNNHFTDLDMDSYYGKAVLWAIEEGLTKGTSETTFSPDMYCSRAHMATFLCRLAEGKAVSDTAEFSDVTADAYYAEAVQWAVENKITNGTGDNKFSPDSTCTRGQMVTFLYRYFAK